MKSVARDKKLWKSLEKGYVEDQMEVNLALFGNEGRPSTPLDRERSQSIDIMGPPKRSASFNNYHSYSKSSSPADSTLLRRSEFSPVDHGTDTENEGAGVHRLPGELDKSERKTLFILKSTLNAAFPNHEFSGLGADQFTREKNGKAVLSSLSNTFRSIGVPSPSEMNGGRGGIGAGHHRGGYASGLSRATTYSAYPGDGDFFKPSSVPTRSEGVDALKELERRHNMSEHGSEMMTATHPVLFNVLDDAIGLRQDHCEVYVWTPPNPETDPHGGGDDDSSDGEWPEGSSDEEDGDDSGGEIFVDGDETESEEEDSDERPPGPFYYPGGISIRGRRGVGGGRRPTNRAGMRQVGSFPRSMNEWEKKSRASRQQQPHSRSPTRNRLRLRGSLLWSNHWFFVNRKQKRVLFISIWAKSRGYGFSPSSAFSASHHHQHHQGVKSYVDGTGLRSSGGGGALGSERFLGWQGAQGAGARAFAARKAGSSLF
jgi:hypothetical protein